MAKFKPPFPGFGTPMPKSTGSNPFRKNVKKSPPKPPKKGKKGR